MSESDNEVAIATIERKIVDAKRDAKDYEARGLPVPGWLQVRIKNLSGAASALRKEKPEGDAR